MNPRRMYRSRDRQLAGVAGGMAEYLEIDPTIIRIAWIIVGIASGGLALIAYLLLALVIPNAPYGMGPNPAAGPLWGSQPGAGWSSQPGSAWPGQPAPGTSQPAPGTSWPSGTAYASGTWTAPAASSQWYPPTAPASYPTVRQTRGLGAAGIVGIVLVVIGAMALLDVTWPGLRFGAALGPAVILALGAALLLSSVRRPVAPSSAASMPDGAATAAADAAAQAPSAWSGVPADVTPWPATTAPQPTTAPAQPAGTALVEPAPASASTSPAFDDDSTKVDPA